MKALNNLAAVTAMLFVYILDIVRAECPPGMFGEQNDCQICPYDHYCPGGTTQPFHCPPGFTSYDGESECRKITEEEYYFNLNRKLFSCSSMPGYYCSSGEAECEDGYYCLGDGSGRTRCPRGKSCLLAGSTENCPDGYYSNIDDDYCHICPRGQYCAATNPPADPVNCGSGQYAYEGSTSCSTCTAGYACAARDQAPTLCTGGKYQPSAGQTSCIDCPAGSSCTSSLATTCSPGTYSEDGWGYCKPCPTGVSCSSGIKGSDCSTGYYSAEGVDSCTQCTAGNYCPNKDNEYECLEGYYSSNGKDECTICQVGYYCTGGVRYECKHGYYADDVGLSECKQVPTHYVANAVIAATSVTRCGENEYTDTYLQTCYECDDAHQCLKDDTVEPCPYGYIKLSGSWYCKPCPARKICTMSGDTSSSQDVEAYVTALGGTAESYPRFSGIAELGPKICPPNNYCTPDGLIYHICPHGYYPYNGGCEPCPDGKFCMTSFKREFPIDTNWLKSNEFDSFPRFQPQGYDWENDQWTDKSRYISDTTARGKIGKAIDGQLASSCPTGYSCTNTNYQKCPSTHLGENIAGEDLGMIAENQYIVHTYSDFSSMPFSKLANSDIDGDVQCLPCNGGYSCELGSSPSSCSSGTYSPTGEPDCLICPPGHYCEAKCEKPVECGTNKYNANAGGTSSSACSNCPTGFYAPSGSSYCMPCPGGYECSTGTPIRCDIGQYSPEGELSCSPCQEGYICDRGSTIATPPENLCPKGSYCESDGTQTHQFKCPAGTYGIAAGARDNTWCIDCPVGYVCREGTDDFVKYPCPKGNYCPTASSIETPCPAGYFNPFTGGMSSDNCLTCPSGFYCPEATATPTICPSGYYCPLGTTKMDEFACPMGSYTGTRTGSKRRSDCLPCPAGSYCEEASILPTPAPVGYYIPYMGATSLSAALKCPAGHPCASTGNYRYSGSKCSKGYYCPPGSSSSTDNPCPAGTYTDREDLWDSSQCSICPSGNYCEEASTSDDITICPTGHYCPAGTGASTQYPCPTGTVGATQGLKADYECSNCTAGGGCGSGSSSTITCEVGYYCPAGTTTSTPAEYRAPAGSFINETGAASEYDNYPCGYGQYCETGATGPTPCVEGTYSNILRADACFTCPAGYFCSGTGVINPTACSAGYYSDEGAASCTRCPEGFYCHQSATSKATMESQPCPAGTICSVEDTGNYYGLATSPSLVTHACPIGKYCEGGADSKDCPAGTYNTITGRKSVNDCLQTPAGFYTLAGASEYLSKPCDAGYYCLAGSTTSNPTPCPAGTFRSEVGGRKPEDCAICKSGYKCPNEGTVTPADCGAGNYCPLGTTIPALCPVGTFSSNVNNPDSRSCTKCSTGYYCGSRGMTTLTPDDYCDAGFYCIEGATRPDPQDGITGMICPAGGYCEAGALSISPCPAGEYNPEEGAKTEDSCIPCLPGKYCAGSMNPEPTGDCDPGFYCQAGSSSPTANSVLAGFYAPAGSDFAIPCPRGTYQGDPEKESCIDCQAGAYCPNTKMIAAEACPAGYYCLSNTAFSSSYYEPQICPMGTYSALTGKTSSSDCTACDGGKYCLGEGLSAVSGACDAGFYCTSGSLYPNPAFDVNDASGEYGPCPEGHYCGASTTTPSTCAAGKYSAMTKLVDNTYCKDCEPGYYCTTAGISAPTGPCDIGYYCEEGSTSATANVCDENYFCPQGSPQPELCPIGFYGTSTGLSKCVECPVGSVCIDGIASDCDAT